MTELVQVCHSSEVNDKQEQDVSVVFRLNGYAMMILDYTLSYNSDCSVGSKVKLLGKKYLLSKSEISLKWKVVPIL